MTTYTLNAHDQSNSQMTLKDLVLLDTIFHGRKMDMTHLFIAKMIKDATDGVIEFSTNVIVIVESLGIILEESDIQYLKNFTNRDYIRFDTLK